MQKDKIEHKFICTSAITITDFSKRQKVSQNTKEMDVPWESYLISAVINHFMGILDNFDTTLWRTFLEDGRRLRETLEGFRLPFLKKDVLGEMDHMQLIACVFFATDEQIDEISFDLKLAENQF